MLGLLDFIFSNIDTQPLNRQEVLDHMHYLDEIITPGMPIPQQVKYYGYKIKLGRKLLELDTASVQSFIYQPRFRQQI
ncbi:MAG: hypothetical protein ACO1OF_18525 [Adhaeribacter sp.]